MACCQAVRWPWWHCSCVYIYKYIYIYISHWTRKAIYMESWQNTWNRHEHATISNLQRKRDEESIFTENSAGESPDPRQGLLNFRKLSQFTRRWEAGRWRIKHTTKTSEYLQGFIHPRWCRILPSTVGNQHHPLHLPLKLCSFLFYHPSDDLFVPKVLGTKSQPLLERFAKMIFHFHGLGCDMLGLFLKRFTILGMAPLYFM